MFTTLIVIHVIISLILIVTVLMQHGKQQGLSGAIAGGAETFFGKNKGRTIDAILKKVTAVVAILFVVSSITLAAYSINKNKADAEAANSAAQTETEGTVSGGLDENGNLVDENGNILMTAEQLAESQANTAEGENAEADAE
ncbi:MAG: preprotein translocase subunit SecG [Ruminococcaceae bacterium]|nr:preprotein translocase subunit SecG [Oscillospiraceae bacterium]